MSQPTDPDFWLFTPGPVPQRIWDALLLAAQGVLNRAYAPYSNYPVGAAAVTHSGRLVLGCNVENASYGLTLCAECSLVSDLVTSGGGQLAAFVCVNQQGTVIMPCGRCRQLLLEHGGGTLAILTASGPQTLSEILPQAWGPDDLKN
ncbi:MAG: cytidine deaminase [Bifidobacteriaceae bacterium]|jgi:cytidine deaminase|nr:cytidine deaminase [Bifidobacteriaceae bacterium]